MSLSTPVGERLITGLLAMRVLITKLPTGKKCIAHIVCTAQHIPIERWALFKEAVREGIRVRRANCNTALKREFQGKNVRNSSIHY